jgi:hypothetical protein
MPDEIKDCVHALVRRTRASHGLPFPDGDGADLNELYPADDVDDDDDTNDSTYDPNDVDVNLSYNSEDEF